MKKEILFVLLKDFADWEGAYIAPNLNLGVEPGSESKYIPYLSGKSRLYRSEGSRCCPTMGSMTFRPIMQGSY